MAQEPFPITPKLIDSLNDPNAEWPDDPAVPNLPPLPSGGDPPIPEDNFLRAHYWERACIRLTSSLRRV
jgi:hypothetical protein